MTLRDAQFEKLEKCFVQVFPKIERSHIAESTSQTVEGWDSIAQVTLLSLIAETFSLELDFEEYEGATSFVAVLDLIRRRTAAG